MDSIGKSRVRTQRDKLDLINYYYGGYIAWCIDNDRKQDAESYIEKSELLISELERSRYELSTLYAYKAAFIGFNLGLSPYKAPFIGPQSISYARRSVEIDPKNPFAVLQLGNISYYTPGVFGGSKKEAMQHYLKALSLMEQQVHQTVTNWNYLNIFPTVIMAYMEQGEYNKARYYCERALTIEPRFTWVRNNIYPEVLKQVKHE